MSPAEICGICHLEKDPRSAKPCTCKKKEEKLDEKDFYINEEGFLVFTPHYHLKRGSCCGNGCKHCPY